MAYVRYLLEVQGGGTINIQEGSGPFTATLGAGPYYLLGDGSSDDLVQAIEDALNASGGDTYTVSLPVLPNPTTDAQIRIASDSNFYVLGTGTFDLSLIDIDTTSTTLVESVDSDGPIPILWHPSAETREWEPLVRRQASQVRTLGNKVWSYARTEPAQDRTAGWDFMTRARTYQDTGGDASLEAFWERSGRGVRFRAYLDTTLLGHYQFEDIERFRANRFSPGVPLYEVSHVLLEDLP